MGRAAGTLREPGQTLEVTGSASGMQMTGNGAWGSFGTTSCVSNVYPGFCSGPEVECEDTRITHLMFHEHPSSVLIVWRSKRRAQRALAAGIWGSQCCPCLAMRQCHRCRESLSEVKLRRVENATDRRLLISGAARPCRVWFDCELNQLVEIKPATPHCNRAATISVLHIRLDVLLSTVAMDTNFRKIDIDQYEEDVLLDSELYDTDPRDPAQALNDVKQNAAVVRSSLAKYVLKLQHGPMYRTSDRLAGMIMSAR